MGIAWKEWAGGDTGAGGRSFFGTGVKVYRSGSGSCTAVDKKSSVSEDPGEGQGDGRFERGRGHDGEETIARGRMGAKFEGGKSDWNGVFVGVCGRNGSVVVFFMGLLGFPMTLQAQACSQAASASKTLSKP